MITEMNFGHITVLGDVMLDNYISGKIERISPEAPVPVLCCQEFRSVAGGAANVAMSAASLRCKVSLVGVVGNDSHAFSLRKILEERGVDLSCLVVDPARPTTVKTRVLGGQQQIVRLDQEITDFVSGHVRAEIVANMTKIIEKTDILICSDYRKGVLSDEVLQFAIQTARARNIPVIIDPKRTDLRCYAGASLLTPNRKELSDSTGMPATSDHEVIEAARAASEQFGGDVLVTRSEDGMTLWRNQVKPFHVEAMKAEVVDVSGAGDTVVATVAALLSAGRDMETAVSIAAAAAAVAVRKTGTATVSPEELSHELERESADTKGVLYSVGYARNIIADWRRHGARVVFTNGCFDLLHPGHISLLEEAAKHGDKLVVAINSDASVKRLKGESRPIQDQKARAGVIGALRVVDMVVIFEEDTPLETIMALRPDVVVKGADYREDEVVGGDFIKSYGGKVVLAGLIEGRSTTALVGKMKG